MRVHEGAATIMLLIGMTIAFTFNRAGKPLWLSLLVGISVGIAGYGLLIWVKFRGMNK